MPISVLADGMPLVWASRILGSPLPEKISGSDLILPLARLAESAIGVCSYWEAGLAAEKA